MCAYECEKAFIFAVFSLAEKDALVTSLQEELRDAKEKMTADDVRFYRLLKTVCCSSMLLTMSPVALTERFGTAGGFSD